MSQTYIFFYFVACWVAVVLMGGSTGLRVCHDMKPNNGFIFQRLEVPHMITALEAERDADERGSGGREDEELYISDSWLSYYSLPLLFHLNYSVVSMEASIFFHPRSSLFLHRYRRKKKKAHILTSSPPPLPWMVFSWPSFGNRLQGFQRYQI